MKIGQFSDSFIPVVDGVGRVVYNYCDTIARGENECSAIVPLTKMGYRGKFPFEIIDYYCRSVPLMPQYKMGVPMTDEHYHQHLDMTNFDIVHVHTPFIAGYEGLKYAKKHNIPVVGTFHSKYYDDFLQLTNSELLAEIGTDVLIVDFFEKCDEVWAVSENSAQTLKSYGYSKEVRVMPNGMSIREIKPEQEKIAREQFHLNDDPIILFVGQMNWKKNILRVLEASAKLKQSGKVFQLVLAGQGPHEQEIFRKVEELGLKDIFTYCGHITDTALLDGLYSAASLFVFPSLYDNAPMVVREASNAFTPSVCVRGSSAAEVIHDGYNGLLCEDDSDDLFRVLSENLFAKEKLAEMGKNARETIPVAWEVIIQDVLERYQYLIDRKKAGLL